jgi:hypothetical protein
MTFDAQNGSAIYKLPDPDEQLRHFNAIVLWLLDLHAPPCIYIKNGDVNPWFTFDIERGMVGGILHIEYGKEA